jgi:hypothetical protein
MANKPILQIYTNDPTILNSTAVPYVITDHNRGPTQISYETIENSARMANGTMRKYITANKKNISFSWTDLPAAAGYQFTSDSNLAGAWLKSFYEENVYNPVWIKLTYSEEAWRFANTNSITSVSSTNFSFNPTTGNDLPSPRNIPISRIAYTAIGASYSPYIPTATNGVCSVVVYTTVNHGLTLATCPEFFITGVGQPFNGTWVPYVCSGSTIGFISASGFNPVLSFNINSYVQSAQSASFNIDNNNFLQVGSVIKTLNNKNISGSSIHNINWTITALSGNNIITASTATASISQIGTGLYGSASITSTPDYKSLSITSAGAYVGTAVVSDVLKVFMTDFSYNIKKRYSLTDIVDVDIKFTEI